MSIFSAAWDWLGGKKKTKKRQVTDTQKDRSPTDEFLQVLIGNPGKVEPKIVFKRISSDKKYLGICCVWGYGPVANADNIKVYLDDLPWDHSSFEVGNGKLAQVQTFTGLDNQVKTNYTWFQNTFSYTGNTHGRGVVYSLIAISLDGDIFPTEPKIYAKISNKVPIVNDGSERHLLSLPDINNPALVASWFLRDNVVGYGFPSSVIGDSFTTVRNWINDNPVQQHTGSSDLVQRFTVNGNLTGKKEDILQEILDTFYAKIVFVDGKFEINIKGLNVNSQLTLDKSNFTKDRTTFEGVDKSSRFNRVIVTFINAELNYESDQAIYPEKDDPLFDTWLAEDKGVLQEEEVSHKLIDNYYEALEQAKILARESREVTTFKLKATAGAGDLIPYDPVIVVEPRKGWSNELFFVETIDTHSDEAEEYDLELKSFNPTIYEWLEKGEYTPEAVIDPVDLRAIGKPTGLAFDANYQTLTWTKPVDTVSGYEVVVYTGSDTSNAANYVKTVTCSTPIKRFNLPPGQYTFIVIALGLFGYSKAELTANSNRINAVTSLAFTDGNPPGTQGKISFSHENSDLVGHFVLSIKDSNNNVVQTLVVQPHSATEYGEFADRIQLLEAP